MLAKGQRVSDGRAAELQLHHWTQTQGQAGSSCKREGFPGPSPALFFEATLSGVCVCVSELVGCHGGVIGCWRLVWLEGGFCQGVVHLTPGRSSGEGDEAIINGLLGQRHYRGLFPVMESHPQLSHQYASILILHIKSYPKQKLNIQIHHHQLIYTYKA